MGILMVACLAVLVVWALETMASQLRRWEIASILWEAKRLDLHQGSLDPDISEELRAQLKQELALLTITRPQPPLWAFWLK